MAFNSKEFMKQSFNSRTEDVRVVELASWFAEGDEPVFKVRGLTFEELNKADNAADNSKAMLNLVATLQTKDGTAIADGIKDAFGIGKDTPANMVKRINHMVMGSVDPEIDEEFAVKLASTFPIEFTLISNKIIELTGKGFMPGKPKGSTRSRTPKQA